ncbi:MAG: hypothetical protein ABI761_02690 [Saprospiraceae bacterium]
MKELKFIKVLTQIPKSELPKIEKFLASPYCNSNTLLFKLFELVLPQIKSGKELITDKEELWSKLIPNIKFNDLKWRKLCNEFLILLQKYFVFEQLSRNDLASGNLLLEFIYEQRIEALYKSSTTHLQDEMDKHKNLSSEFHLQRFQFEKNLYNIQDYEINLESRSNIETIHKHLDLFYISEKTKQLVNTASRRQFVNLPIEIKLEKQIIDIVEKNDFLAFPEIDVYYRIYKLKQEKYSNKAYEELKEKLNNHLIKFSQIDGVEILKEVINFCSYQYNRGQHNLGLEALQWYKYGLKFDLIFPSNKFNPGDFLNIVILGIRTKEFTWTENFIEDYQKIIPEDQKLTLVTFSLARLYFNQHKFELVIEKLRNVEFGELTYNLDSKVLLLATYFEVEEWQAMGSLADSFRTFLNRHEKDIAAAKKLRYSNFIKYIKKLSRVKYQDKPAKQRLLTEIQESEGIVNQGWLIEKAIAI